MPLRFCLGCSADRFCRAVSAAVRNWSNQHGQSCLCGPRMGGHCVGSRIAADHLGRHQRLGGGGLRSTAGESLAACNGTDVARSSQRRRRTRSSGVAGPTDRARSAPKCASVMVMATRRARLGPWGCASRVVSTDLCADATVVFSRDVTSYAEFVALGAAADGFPGVRCVVGKIQRFQVTKIQGDTLQVKNP